MAAIKLIYLFIRLALILLLMSGEGLANDETTSSSSSSSSSSSTTTTTTTASSDNGTTINNTDFVTETTPVAETTTVAETSTTSSTTTERPSTNTELNYKEKCSKVISQNPCSCDLKVDVCDIDCWCDSLCKEYYNAFDESKCDLMPTLDPRYCYSSDIIYNNNTGNQKIKSNALFCIVFNNANEMQKYQSRKAMNSTDFEMIKSSHKYDWGVAQVLRLKEPKENFKSISGSDVPVLQWVNESLDDSKVHAIKPSKWKIPFSLEANEGECNSLKTVKYLRDTKSSCFRLIKNLENECQNNTALDAKFFSSFDFVQTNKSGEIEYTTKSSCINITSSETLKDPMFSLNKCENAVQAINYTIVHNGSEGIIEARISVKYAQLDKNTKWFKQEYSVIFVFENETNVIEMSGNPGYILGKPIITRRDKINSTQYGFYRVLTDTKDGICGTHNNKNSIKFGINSRSGCLFNFTSQDNDNSTCRSIQKQILEALEEPQDEIKAYGNLSSSIIGEFIKINKSPFDENKIKELESGKCPTLITGISLHFYYILEGDVSEPQAKIIGAKKEFYQENDVIVKCDSCPPHLLYTELSVSASFHDLTNPSKPETAPPPVFKMLLPHDFFYPFLVN